MDLRATDNVQTSYFYDCMTLGLFESRRAMTSFLDNFLMLQGQTGLSREEVSKLRGYFGVDDSNSIRPMWLSRSFIAPHIAFLSANCFDLLVPRQHLALEPVITSTPNEPFPCRLDGVSIYGNIKDQQANLYMLGSVVMATTMDLIRGKVALDSVAAELMRFVTEQGTK